MLYKGYCSCQQWQVEISVEKPLASFNPRICDCSYCQDNPAAIISDPAMMIAFLGQGLTINKNGDQLADFYYCNYCGDLLVVACNLNGQLRGAVNANLLLEANQLGKPHVIQPRLLSAKEKRERWGSLWGVLSGV
jgi:hypothetical protein